MGVREALTALLFDFDGTIADTAALWRDGTRTGFARGGFTLDDVTLSAILGGPWQDALPDLSAAAATSIELDIVASIREEYLCVPPVAGLEALLDSVGSIPKAVVSSSYRAVLVSPYLERHGLSHHFPVVVGCDDTRRLKPHPEPVLLALRRLGVGADGAWLIGDSEADVQAARAAHVGSITVGDPLAGGDRSVDSIESIRALLPGLLAEHVDGSG